MSEDISEDVIIQVVTKWDLSRLQNRRKNSITIYLNSYFYITIIMYNGHYNRCLFVGGGGHRVKSGVMGTKSTIKIKEKKHEFCFSKEGQVNPARRVIVLLARDLFRSCSSMLSS